MPGSRPHEIRDHLPTMLEAARGLHASHSQRRSFEFIVPLAPTLNTAQRAEVHRMIQELASDLTVRLVDDARAALFHARASVVASGTATVEAALIGNPFVVVYRVSPVTYAIAKRVVKVPHVAMANLIAGKRVVPELIQNDFTAANIVQHLEPLLPDGTPRESMKKELESIRKHCSLETREPTSGAGSGAIERAAAITIGEISAGPIAGRIGCAILKSNRWDRIRLPDKRRQGKDVTPMQYRKTAIRRCSNPRSPCAWCSCPSPCLRHCCCARDSRPSTAQRPNAPALDITGYVIDAELDTDTHHITAKTVVTFTAPPNLEVVNFGFHPALKITKITDAAGKLLDGERTADGAIRVTAGPPLSRATGEMDLRVRRRA